MLIKIKVFPKSKKEIIKKSEDRFKIKVKEKPERGLVNKGVVRIIASYFKIPESKIRLIKDFKVKNKIFEITKI